MSQRKLDEFGDRFIEQITAWCQQHQLPTNVEVIVRPPQPNSSKPTLQKTSAYRLFAKGASLEEVAAATGRAQSTIVKYLEEWIQHEKPPQVRAWVPDAQYEQVLAAAGRLGADRLRPIYEELNEELSYETIRITLAHYAATVAAD